MKATNQFDYPTATASTYKQYKYSKQDCPEDAQKKKYQEIIKQEKQNQRNRVKRQNQKKKQQLSNEQQQNIRAQIDKRKRQIEELQQMKKITLENERKAQQLAKIKQQQDKIKQIQRGQKQKEDDENAQFRFKDALRRLEAEKQQQAYKERQAQLRHKIAQQTKSQERIQAMKYQSFLEAKQKQERQRLEQEQKRSFEIYQQGLGRHGFTKQVDYTKTCMHNPLLILRNKDDEIQNAVTKGQKQQQKRRQISQKRRLQRQDLNRKSIERGNKAIQKINMVKEYNQYSQEAERQQRTYNLERIQAGKKNQYTGLKPLTLAQIDANQKIRSEQQFENMFIKKPQMSIKDHQATQYQIYQQRMINPHLYSQESQKYNFQNEGRSSIFENNSIPKYSFEEIDDTTPDEIRVLPKSIMKQTNLPSAIQNNKMIQSRKMKNNQHQEELSYSESEQDSNI